MEKKQNIATNDTGIVDHEKYNTALPDDLRVNPSTVLDYYPEDFGQVNRPGKSAADMKIDLANQVIPSTGLTIRLTIAIEAMKGMLANPTTTNWTNNVAIPAEAFKLADAMLEEAVK